MRIPAAGVGRDELTRENFETVYEIHHKDKYGFGGDTNIRLAVLDETDTRIEGRKFGIRDDWPGEKVVVNKANVAAWEEKSFAYNEIPEDPTPQRSAEEVREAYANGYIDEDEMEAQLESAIE